MLIWGVLPRGLLVRGVGIGTSAGFAALQLSEQYDRVGCSAAIKGVLCADALTFLLMNGHSAIARRDLRRTRLHPQDNVEWQVVAGKFVPIYRGVFERGGDCVESRFPSENQGEAARASFEIETMQ